MSRPNWEIPQREATDEATYLNRRVFIRRAGLGAIGIAAGCSYEKSFDPVDVAPETPIANGPDTVSEVPEAPVVRCPAPVNPSFAALDRPLTDELAAARYNNFYEFTQGKDAWRFTDGFAPKPWTIEIAGLVAQARTYDIDQLIAMTELEERLDRHRCVEAWSMAPALDRFSAAGTHCCVKPLASARYLRMTSFCKPEIAQGQWDSPNWPWAYSEGLTMAEATNELSFLATGIYGRDLPKQHGAPLRLVTPWKYGYKGIKSIARIDSPAISRRPSGILWRRRSTVSSPMWNPKYRTRAGRRPPNVSYSPRADSSTAKPCPIMATENMSAICTDESGDTRLGHSAERKTRKVATRRDRTRCEKRPLLLGRC